MQNLSNRAKVAIAMCILASAGFFLTAFIEFLREGDWPARYISAGATILAVMLIAIKRHSRRDRKFRPGS